MKCKLQDFTRKARNVYIWEGKALSSFKCIWERKTRLSLSQENVLGVYEVPFIKKT